MRKMICGFAVFLAILAGAPAQAQNWVLYDDFNWGFIDPDRWAAYFSQNVPIPKLIIGDNLMEVEREFLPWGWGPYHTKGRLHIRNHSYGKDVPPLPSGTYSPFLTETLYILRDTKDIKGMKARLKVVKAEVTGCQATTALPTPGPAITRARIWGYFFSSNQLLDISAYLLAERSSASTDPPGVLDVKGAISSCGDLKCTYSFLVAITPSIGKVHLWEPFDLTLKWDPANNKFIYQVNNNAPAELSYGDIGDTKPPQNFDSKGVGIIHFFAPCTTSEQESDVDAYFDNVYVFK